MRFGTGLCLLVPAVVAACGGVQPAPSDAAVHTVNVQRSHAGGGTVTSTVGGIACGATCSASVSDGTVMTLTAVADDGAVFAGWSGPCSDTSPTCTFTVQGDVTVGAAFDVQRVTVTVTVASADNGTGMVTGAPGALSCPGACSVSVDKGTQITLTAAAQTDSVFVGWSVSACTGTGPCALTVNSDQNVIATFARQQSLVVARSGSGTGTVTSSPAGIACGSDCSEVYPPGTVVTLTAIAASGSRFAGWTGGGCTGTGTCVVTVNAAMMVVAQFDRLCTLTVARLGAGAGTVTSNPSGISCGADCTEDYVCGTPVQLTAAPNGSTFFGWSNGCTGTGACSVTLTTSTTINATFTKCGNNVVEPGEECDDGNATNGDNCEANCTLPRCGNGIIDPSRGETCDDANANNNDACTNACHIAVCGDRITRTGVEECDDGNTTNDDTCDNNCTIPRCGNGIRDPSRGEKCDDGNAINNDFCDNNCQCGGIGQPCCATGPQCNSGSGCLANICTTCPAPPTTTLRATFVGSNGANCFGTNTLHPFPIPCDSGTHHERCDVTDLNPPGDGTSCQFDNWINPSNPSDCGCVVRMITPADCFKGVTCSVSIFETTDSPPKPVGCP